MADKSSIKVARLRRPEPVLVCKKCLSRVADGRALKRTLKSELKQRSRARALKRPRVVLTGCLGICPRRAVVVANGASLHRGEYLLLENEAAVGEAIGMLMQSGIPN
jgi:predicted metal-binding protein